MKVAKIKIKDFSDIPLLFGKKDENLRLIEKNLGVEFVLRDNSLKIKGEDESVDKAKKLVEDFIEQLQKGHSPEKRDIQLALKRIKEGKDYHLEDYLVDVVITTPRGKKIRPYTEGQKRYVEAIGKNDVVFAIGPAGTGKTYLAVAMAVSSLQKGEVARIILTRPTVEAGEKLGFLPGGLEEKVEPYLRPLYDALYEMLLAERFHSFMEQGIIEVAPLAYMRGRTLNEAFIILDEAQNTTHEQMKMFLTRLGFGSKAVITGDITQIDLPPHKTSGLVEAQSLFKGVEGIQIVYLTRKDVVRHRLVQEIVKAYESYEKRKRGIKEESGGEEV